MRKSRRPIVIASRASRLARIQAQLVGKMLQHHHPDVVVDYRWIESEGDRQTEPLTEAGGKGLFVRSIEQAVLDGRADLAVHSLKDLPAERGPALSLAAVPLREDPRDCLIARSGADTIEQLRRGAVVGTTSPRRSALLRRLRPDLLVRPLRGNVQTRLEKVLGGQEYDATLLAVAGLNRLGLSQHARGAIDPAMILPAASQGALALQCRPDDHLTLRRCLPLNHAVSAFAVQVERQIVAALEGDCRSPVAVLAEPAERDGEAGCRVRVQCVSGDGRDCVQADQWLGGKQITRPLRRMVEELRRRGAHQVIRRRSSF